MAAAEPPPAPLTLAELDAALAGIGGFEPHPLIAVGVSGGPDSLALAILAARWARQRGGTAWALVVDHGLRPESGVEAETVGGWLAARGIPHARLAWCGDKPATGIQEAARRARYRLIVEWCVTRGCLHLLTAHHRDDQAETYLIRRRAKSGADGLAGISAVRELAGLRLVRPLLGIAKARLIAFLDGERQPYLLDPSNRNPAFERVRLRLAMSAAIAPHHPSPRPACGERGGRSPLGWEGNEPPATQALREVHTYAASRIAREKSLAALLARAVALHPAGFAAIDPGPLAAAEDMLAEQALGRVAAAIGGEAAAYPSRRDRLRRLRRALIEDGSHARTLGGCRFVAWRGRVLVLREGARVAPPVALAPGRGIVWDHRFFAMLPANAPGPVTLGALGMTGVAALGRHRVADDNPLPRLVYPALPAIRDAEGLAAVPHLGWRRTAAWGLPEPIFRPVVSLFSAGFTVV